MSTLATTALHDFANGWRKLYHSAVVSGIVGDKAHAARGGYHISRYDNPAGNYSIVRPDDLTGPKNAAAAVDMSMNTSDMVLCTKRVAAAYKNTSDPRRKYLNAVNGWDGSGAATRFDFYARKTAAASADHKWHMHLEFRRRYTTSTTATRAVLSILAGESVADYLESIGVIPVVKAAVVTVAPVAPPWPGKMFKLNPHMKPDPDLRKWQTKMRSRGWKSLGTADGIFGPKTDAVVRKFQRACKVTVDGEIGRVTWALPWTWPTGS